MNDLSARSTIAQCELDSADYCRSLLRAAEGKALLSISEAAELRADLFELLARRIRLYNGADSSSIPIETAQELLSSALFTVGLALKACPSPDAALSALKAEGFAALYERGRKKLGSLLLRCKALHCALAKDLFPSPNVFYRATVLGGVPGFFKLYRPDHSAHLLHITADYPLVCPPPPLLGAEFIHKYLLCLSRENAFLSHFSPVTVHALLKAHKSDYEKTPLNLSSPVLACALACVLTGSSARPLCLSHKGLVALSTLFTGRQREEIHALLSAALGELSLELELSRELTAYLSCALPQISGYAANARDLDAISRIFALR